MFLFFIFSLILCFKDILESIRKDKYVFLTPTYVPVLKNMKEYLKSRPLRNRSLICRDLLEVYLAISFIFTIVT